MKMKFWGRMRDAPWIQPRTANAASPGDERRTYLPGSAADAVQQHLLRSLRVRVAERDGLKARACMSAAAQQARTRCLAPLVASAWQRVARRQRGASALE